MSLARRGCSDSSDQVSEAYLSVARRAGLASPLTGLTDERLQDPESLLQEGWTGDSQQGYAYSAPDGRSIQHYTRYAEGPFQERLTTYSRRSGHHFEAEVIVRQRDGTTCRFMQGG
ncbi:MAG: hypothetical protein HY319_25795 [Armatimonadetes bacterium]|nr:hypothetical protein [Armatimonadota bacterium]